MDALLSISERYKIAVIEDAAEAIGSSIRDRKAGSMGLFGTFSFHGTKTVTTGEGGMFVTNDAELFEKVLTLSNHGRARGQTRQFWPDVIGFKFKMSNVQAAIGCGQIERIEELVGRKREILSLYKDKLGTLSDVFLNPEHTETINGAWMPTVVLSERLGISTKNLQEAFQEADVDARVFFHPLSSLPMFEKHYDNANLYNLNAWSIPQRAINLPSYHDMSSDDIDRVSNVVLDLVSRRR